LSRGTSDAIHARTRPPDGGPAIPRSLWLIATVVFCLACAHTLLLHRDTTSAPLFADARGYHELAVGLLDDGAYHDRFWPPGYPALVAAVYAVAGRAPVAVYLVQALLLAATTLVVHDLARLLTGDRRKALFAAACFAAWPLNYLFAASLLTETVATLLILLLVDGYLRLLVRPGRRLAVALGVGLAAGALVKSVVFMLPLAMLAIVLLWRRYAPARRAVLLAGGVFVLAMMPWAVRNAVVLGEFIPVAPGGCFNLWLGNWPTYYQERWTWGDYPEPLATELEGLAVMDRERVFLDAAVQGVREDPGRAARLVPLKLSVFWFGGLGRDPAVFGPPWEAVIYVPLFALAVAGLFLVPRARWHLMRPAALLVLAYSLTYAVFIVANHRHVLPVMSLEFVLASYPLAWALRRVGRGHLLTDPAAGAAAAADPAAGAGDTGTGADGEARPRVREAEAEA